MDDPLVSGPAERGDDGPARIMLREGRAVFGVKGKESLEITFAAFADGDAAKILDERQAVQTGAQERGAADKPRVDVGLFGREVVGYDVGNGEDRLRRVYPIRSKETDGFEWQWTASVYQPRETDDPNKPGAVRRPSRQGGTTTAGSARRPWLFKATRFIRGLQVSWRGFVPQTARLFTGVKWLARANRVECEGMVRGIEALREDSGDGADTGRT